MGQLSLRLVRDTTTALTLYEYSLTLSNEVALFWRSKPSSASALFFLLRIVLFAIAATDIAGNLVPDATAAVSHLHTIVRLPPDSNPPISAIRVFAVTGRSWVLTFLTLALGLVPVAINIYLLTTAHFVVEVVPTMTVCAATSTLSTEAANKVALASRLCVILSDIFVVSTTWFNLFHSARLSIKSGIFDGSISWFLLRDGTLFFSLILILNLIDILLWWFDRIQFFTTLIFPISLILLSRLLMNLRQAAYSDMVAGSPTSPTRSLGPDLPTQMSDVLFVPRSPLRTDTETEVSPTLETFEDDDDDLEMSAVVIADGDDSPVDAGQREADALK
ncbi:hypothetical protein DAEQUDRAFT_712578 [Daedalea quercina L-15889]|uniref:DUF6533 domain-containing protein n=1 Tax=Daedalea quercina L-15889 TaxID=1314783 RepID=A0A165P8Z0_9APHY|nr:hypothetical protein DAEQUDRAFT_712578 [Daedalea quercina L-15889]